MDLKTLLKTTHKILDENGIDHALIGGLALGALGVQRFTNDVDFLISDHDRQKVKKAFLGVGYSIFYESAEVLQLEGAGKVDFLLARRDLSRKMLADAKGDKTFGIKCVGVEDFIGLKIQSFSNNPKREFRDKADIQSLIELYDDLDWKQVKMYAELFGAWDVIQKIRGYFEK